LTKLVQKNRDPVIPAEAGIRDITESWVPAFAGMAVKDSGKTLRRKNVSVHWDDAAYSKTVPGGGACKAALTTG
jgi:hypothetical protein